MTRPTRQKNDMACKQQGNRHKCDRIAEQESDRATGQESYRLQGNSTGGRQHSTAVLPTTAHHRSPANRSDPQQLCPRLHSTSAQPIITLHLSMNVELHLSSHAEI